MKIHHGSLGDVSETFARSNLSYVPKDSFIRPGVVEQVIDVIEVGKIGVNFD